MNPPFDSAISRRLLTLSRDGKKERIDVAIGPLTQSEQDISCHVRIKGEGQQFDQDIFGEDGIQATQLAMTFAGSTLDRIAGTNGTFVDEAGTAIDHDLGRIIPRLLTDREQP